MIKLIAIVALALAGMNNAQSIGITLDRIAFQVGSNEIEIYPPFSRFHMDNEQQPWLNPNYAVDWFFANSEESASLAGYTYVRGSGMSNSARVEFSLPEAVAFELSGWIMQGEWVSWSYTEMFGRVDGFEGFGSVLDIGPSGFPVLRGLLQAGEHVFASSGYAFDTESTSYVKLLLTPVAIPDGGSTLMLMGLALGVIGILRLPKALA